MRRLYGILAFALAAAIVVPLAGSHLFGWGSNPAVVPAPAKRIEIGNGRFLNVLDVGEGSPVVLVHGLPSSIQDWGETPGKLAAMGHRVLVYDRVGYGSSSRDAGAPGEYTYPSNARDLGALLDALGIGRAALAGWSYGGAVVQTFAREQPERVSHVALIGSVGPAEQQEEKDALGWILGSGVGEEVLRWSGAVAPVGRAFTQENLKAAFARESAIPDGFNERTRAMLALPGTLAAFVAESQRGEPSALRPDEIRVPAVVLHGTDDRLVPIAVGEDLARRLPAGMILRVPEGSHMLPVTHPDLVAGALHALTTQN